MPGRPPVAPPESAGFADLHAWLRVFDSDRVHFDAQWRLQSEVADAAGPGGWPGWCGLCSRAVAFGLPSHAAGGHANLREEMVCPDCRLTARNRAALSLLTQGLATETAEVYLTEQASAAYVWLQSHCPRLQGSEFGLDEATRPRLQAWYESLGGKGELVERDVTRLAFADASLDAIGSFDVLEHVPDYPAALREFARCLRADGRLVLTAPFADASAQTLVRARVLADGSIEHLCEPEIHGDPVAGGVLCFYHFGWDLLDAARDAGFRDAQWVRTWSPREGLFSLWTLVATR
ncbi:MAG: class I SAM-dependent methyltransferase [Arenimonas sp.]|nr:class I SAM-dependent methyltransferase [Arenimonas sp.]